MNDSIKLYLFKKQLEYLEKKTGKGTELISLYIPPDRNLADVMNYLKEEYSQAANIKSSRTRKNVQAAIVSIMQRIKLFNKPPENGLVIFAGTISENNKEKLEIFLIEPIDKIRSFIYRCDSKFFLEPLKEMLTYKKDAYGLLVLDRGEATIGILKGKNITIVKHIESNVPRKHGKGGQSQRRFERLIEQAAHEYFKRVAEKAKEIFSSIENLKGIIIGGPGPTKELFVKEGYLGELTKKVLDIVDTSYTDEYGIRELVDKAEKILKEEEINREKRLVRKFLEEVAKDGLAIYGEKDVREAIENGYADIVLISEKYEKYRVKISCKNCKYEKYLTVENLEEFERRLSSTPCPKCNSNTLEIESYKTIIEELSELSEKTGAKVEIISTETEEGMQFLAFGGIGALLRYKV